MVQFRVTIPAHVKSGQTIFIRCPDGSEGDIKVPRGLKGGDSFIFEMKGGKNSFMDREVSTLNDFFVALGVGIVIGLSIVMGFLLGVLYVTSSDDGSESS